MGQVGQVGDDSKSPAVYLPFSSRSPLAFCVFSRVPLAITHTRCVTAELFPEQMALPQPSQQQADPQQLHPPSRHLAQLQELVVANEICYVSTKQSRTFGTHTEKVVSESDRPLLRTSLVTKNGKGSAGRLGPSKPLSTLSSQHLNI
jgi:hypothetical protein